MDKFKAKFLISALDNEPLELMKDVLKGIKYPLCPDCDNCGLIKDCKTYETVNLSISVNNYAKISDTNQKELNKLFL